MIESRSSLRERVLKQLNQLAEADPDAMHALIEHREKVNDKIEGLSNNDTVFFEDENGQILLGVLGVINGILGPEHKISGVYGDDGKLKSFREASNGRNDVGSGCDASEEAEAVPRKSSL